MKIDGPKDEGDEGVGEDRRRAKLVDVQRLEAAVQKAEGRFEALEKALLAKENAPVPRGQFYANLYAMAALKNAPNLKGLRDYADQAWSDYNEALELQPRKTLEERYGGKRPEAYVAFAGNVRPLSEPTPKGEATPATFSHTAIEAVK